MNSKRTVALLHGAGYAGGEVIQILLNHPEIELTSVTSRSFAGQPLWHAHLHLKDQTDLLFSDPSAFDPAQVDGLLTSGEHGQSAALLANILAQGYEGVAVDLSADFRLHTAEDYKTWYNFEHPHPELLDRFIMGCRK